MKRIQLTHEEKLRHIWMWVFLLAFMPLVQSVKGKYLTQFIFSLVSVINYAVPYYLLLLIVFPLFYDKNKFIFCLFFLFTLLLFFAIDFLNLRVILPALGGYRFRVDNAMPVFIRGTFLHYLYLAIPAIGAYLNKRVQKETQERIQKEKDMLKKELDFLSNQFHSHLTFNFLNFCYRKFLESSHDAADTLMMFSSMLHYSLTVKEGQYAPLSQEIEYIENFIEIQRCITSEIFINFQCTGNLDHKEILPGIMSVFIENAFKHGVVNDPNSPMDIYIKVDGQTLTFNVENKKIVKNNMFLSGIGLDNIKQVLKFFYNEMYDLKINYDDVKYSSQLKLQLNPKAQ